MPTRREQIEEHKREIQRLTTEQAEYQPTFWVQTHGSTVADSDRNVPAMRRGATMPVNYSGSVADWVKDCVQQGFDEEDLVVVISPADPMTPNDAPAHEQRVSLWEVRRTVSGSLTVDAPQQEGRY